MDQGIAAPHAAPRLGRAFYERPTATVARALLGCLLVASRADGPTSGRIVETEAYLGPEDPASHAAWHRTGGFQAMWGPPGIAYVYRSYGIHAMLNVVAEAEGVAGAVLLRAVAPVSGLDLMRRRRGVDREQALCSGPGRLCQAFAIRLTDHGRDLVASDVLWIAPGPPPAAIVTTPRIGISRGLDAPLRFFDPDCPHVSRRNRSA